MRASADKRSIEEIVADIIKECGDATIEALVRTLISGMLACLDYPPLVGNRKVNETYAKQLLKRIDKLRATLEAVPDGFPLLHLLSPEKFLPLFFPQQRGITMQIAPEVIDALKQETDIRWDRFSEELTRLREQCERIIELQVGEHGSAGYQQERAAIASREIMEQCGLPLSCSPTSKYCLVASWFFEAMTGEYDRDLRRACESMSRSTLYTEKAQKA